MDQKKVNEYLEIFGVSFDDELTSDIVAVKFRQLSKKYHPDSAEEQYKDGKMFIVLCEAREFILNNIDKFKKPVEKKFDPKDKRVKEFYMKLNGFVDSIKPEDIVINNIKYTFNLQMLIKQTARFVFYQLKEYGLCFDLIYCLGVKAIIKYLDLIKLMDPQAYFAYIFAFASYSLSEINYENINIENALNSEITQLNSEEAVLNKIGKFSDTIRPGEDINLGDLLANFQKTLDMNYRDRPSRMAQAFLIFNIARRIEKLDILKINKISLFKPSYLTQKESELGTINVLERSIYEAESILHLQGENVFDYYADSRNFNFDEQQTFLNSLQTGLSILNYSLVDFSSLLKVLKRRIFEDNSITTDEIVKLAGFTYIASTLSLAFCKAIGLDPKIEYSKAWKRDGINTPSVSIGFMLDRFDNVIFGGLMNAIEKGVVSHYNIDEVINLLKMGDSYNGYERENQKVKQNEELRQKMIQEYQKSQPKGGCYIATAVYGSYNCPEVWVLRRFRDIKLRRTIFGKLFIKIYYFVSPKLVKAFGKTKWFKNLWKRRLDKMVANLKNEGFEDTPYYD